MTTSLTLIFFESITSLFLWNLLVKLMKICHLLMLMPSFKRIKFWLACNTNYKKMNIQQFFDNFSAIYLDQKCRRRSVFLRRWRRRRHGITPSMGNANPSLLSQLANIAPRGASSAVRRTVRSDPLTPTISNNIICLDICLYIYLTIYYPNSLSTKK